MSRSRISQREARRWKKRALAAEGSLSDHLAAWGRDYPGVHLTDVPVHDPVWQRVHTASRLRHLVIARIEGPGLRLFAVAVPR